MTLLQRDLIVAQDNTQQLREGAVRTATSLPALAAAAASGFIIAKIARAPRRPRRIADPAAKISAADAALNASTSLAWQFLMPLAISWIQARFAPQEPAAHSEEQPTEP